MVLSTTYQIPLTSQVQTLGASNFVIRSVLIENNSADSLLFDNTVDPVIVVPPGVTVPINVDHLVYNVRVRSYTNTTGSAKVTLSDSARDTSRAAPLQQLPGGVSISGTVTLPPGSQVGIDPGSNVVSDPPAQTLLTAIQTLITTLNNLATAGNANTDALLGLLPNTQVSGTFTTGTNYGFSLLRAVQRLTFTIATVRREGNITIFVTIGGTTIYLIQNQFVGNYDGIDFPYVSKSPIPKNSTITFFTDAGDFDVTVRY